MTGTASFDPLAILRTLNSEAVEYAVIGGFAVASFGVVRATEDIDVVVERGLENARRLASALGRLGADTSASGVPVRAEALVRNVDLRFMTRNGSLHILRRVLGVPRYADLEVESVVVAAVEFRRPTLEALKRMKRAADRDKDRIDLAELEVLGGG